MLAKTDRSGLVRDLNNNALLSNDITSLISHRQEFQRKQEMQNKFRLLFDENYKKYRHKLSHHFLLWISLAGGHFLLNKHRNTH